MKRLFALFLGSWLLIGASGAGASIILNTGVAGSDSETVTGLTLGNGLTFEYMFSAVTYTGGNFIGFNASVINPLLGAFPAGQFSDNRAAVTGWLPAFINTAPGGTVHDLAFTANTFGAAGNSATIEIRNIAIDGRSIEAVPEPGTLALFGLGLCALVLLNRSRR